MTPGQKIHYHRSLLIFFILVLLGIIIWKRTSSYNDPFYVDGLDEVRRQVLSEINPTGYTGNSDMTQHTSSSCGSVGGCGADSKPCFLQLKNNKPAAPALPALPPPIKAQYRKCMRCESVINRAVIIKPAHGQTYIAKKSDNNSLVLLDEGLGINPGRMITHGKFKLILGVGDPMGVSIYHAESDRLITYDSLGKVGLVRANDLNGRLKDNATFYLVDGPNDYTSVTFMTKSDTPLTKSSKYLGFKQPAIGSIHMSIIELPDGKTPSNAELIEFELLDFETRQSVIMNKHTSSDCPQLAKECFDDCDTNPNRDIRDKYDVTQQSLGSLINNTEVATHELYTDIPSPNNPNNNITNINTNQDILSANKLFTPASGLQFSDALNKIKPGQKQELEDKVFEKLYDARIDPSVRNILEYNSAMYDVYHNENQGFENKIMAQKNKNNLVLDGLVSELDQFRIQKMAGELFYLQEAYNRRKDTL